MALENLTISLRPLNSLVPYARNPRTHSDAQIAQIAASIREFGWTNPLLIDDQGSLIAGHGRLLAARQLGLTEVPAITLAHLSEAQKRALVIADNKLALNAGWDEDQLRIELVDLKTADFDLSTLGFEDFELADLFIEQSPSLTDPDDVPEVAEAICQLGDVWTLGRHRLVCGDATSEVDVSLCLAGVRPHLMVTDPPYGVDYDPTWRSDPSVAAAIRHPKKGAVGEVTNDYTADWREAWALYPGEVAYVWHAGNKAHVVAESLMVTGFELRSQIIWAKHRFVLGRGHYHPQHEPCWYAVRGVGHWQGDRTQSTLWQLGAHQRSETGHSAQKPVECMRRPIENNSSPGQAVYDPFVGSGTTIIAAEMTGRSCHAIEISPQYCDVAITRWQNFTGQRAIVERTGETFP